MFAVVCVASRVIRPSSYSFPVVHFWMALRLMVTFAGMDTPSGRFVVLIVCLVLRFINVFAFACRPLTPVYEIATGVRWP